ncbi:MAG: DUF411 domain-containing protein [Gallionella sp.]|nr:DUF411 domain-containing protein [Gallionella sp.]
MKTNEVSFDKTNKTNFAKPSGKNRTVLCGLVLCAALGAAWPGIAQPFPQGSRQAASVDSGQTLPVVEIYKSAQCGCCKLWAEHLQKNGFTVILHDVGDVPAARKKLGMPSQYGSCHTAKVGQYLVEGHVPAADIKRLLKERPKAIGLAVPSMPPGSPGMESDDPVPYDTLLVGKNGKAKVFAQH